jgi:hypothetical protein
MSLAGFHQMYKRGDRHQDRRSSSTSQACNVNLGKGYFPRRRHIAAYLNLEFWRARAVIVGDRQPQQMTE